MVDAARLSDLTQRQRAVHDFIARCCDEQGRPPSYAEVSREFNFASRSAVSYFLRVLKRRGLVTHEARLARTVRPTGTGRRCTLPVLGMLQNGRFIPCNRVDQETRG